MFDRLVKFAFKVALFDSILTFFVILLEPLKFLLQAHDFLALLLFNRFASHVELLLVLSPVKLDKPLDGCALDVA